MRTKPPHSTEATLDDFVEPAPIPLSVERRITSLQPRAIDTRSEWRPLEPTPVFDAFWHLAAERQKIYYRRVLGFPSPWTNDPILRYGRFTNAYRVADRVTQYLLTNIQYVKGFNDVSEQVFRTLLFKIFNRIDTWQNLTSLVGEPTRSEYSMGDYVRAFDELTRRGPVYSAAYIVPPVPSSQSRRKHVGHLRLLEKMSSVLPGQLVAADSQAEVFELLRTFPGIGPFLAYQLTIDLDYSGAFNWSRNEFVVAGPGAKRGIRKCFSTTGGLTDADLIRLVHRRQAEEFEAREIDFLTLFGHPLDLIDIQNLFCEVDKYARAAFPEIQSGRTRIKQRFKPTGAIPRPWFPPSWNLNSTVEAVLGRA